MRDLITNVTDAMAGPTAKARAEAATAEATSANHGAYLQAWECLQTIEVSQPPLALPKPRALTVAAWNIERCKHVEDSADLLRRVGADVVLATEMDHGMARSGQRHTTRDLAQELGFGYAFGVEFVELGTGDPYETGLFADVPNDEGLHGNAILSRYPIHKPRVIPLDDRGLWYTGAPKKDGQRRVGGRMAIAVEIQTAFGPLTFVAVHYESESDATGRAAQTVTMLDALPDGPTIIGGDLNTAALTGSSRSQSLFAPEDKEPSFTHFSQAGFSWQTANTGDLTTRAAPGKPVRYPLKRLDWLFCRGVSVHAPEVHAAVSDCGDYLSDHELITARIAP